MRIVMSGSSATRQLALLALCVGSLSSFTAQADLPPPDDYVEQCTRALQEQDGEYCELFSAWREDAYGCARGGAEDVDEAQCDHRSKPDGPCCANFRAKGLTYRCSTFGATAYRAMWCRARQEDDPPRPARPEPPPSSASPSSAEASSTTLWWALAGGGLVLLAGLVVIRFNAKR